MDNQNQYSTETVIMAALSTLNPSQLSHLTTSISSLFNRQHRRLASLLSSPPLFSLTLHHLNSLSLFHKSQLIARHLLSNLTYLIHFLHHKTSPPPSSYPSTAIKLRDLDAVLLLLLFCELRQHDPKALDTSPTEWRLTLCNYYVFGTMLTLSGLSVSSSEVLSKFIELVTKCIKFVSVMDCGGEGGGREVAASVGVVVALPSVEVNEGGKECLVCKEEMQVGRDVCELPCNHLFHWMCILPWLSKTNTCPCCRYRLPTDDVSGEIERLWKVLVEFASGSYDTSVKQLIT